MTEVGGRNWFGFPNFRAMWGWNRLEKLGGAWTQKDAHGNWTGEVVEYRWIPKYAYLNLNRWYIERWMMPFESPEEWETKFSVDTTHGKLLTMPYPQFGEYEHCMTIEKPCFLCSPCEKGEYPMCEDKQFLQLSPSIVDSVVRVIERRRNIPSLYKRLAIESKLAAEEKGYDSYADSVLSDINKFQGKIHVYQ